LRFTALAPLPGLLEVVVVPETTLGGLCLTLFFEISWATASRVKEGVIHHLAHVLIGSQLRCPLEIHLQHGLLV
jgi:hypothetical protein